MSHESDWPWFEFPAHTNGRQELVTLFELHPGRSFLKFCTQVPGHPGASVVNLVAFSDEAGDQGFTLAFQREFERFATALHAGLSSAELAELRQVCDERRLVARMSGAADDELFVLVPSAIAREVTSLVDKLLEACIPTPRMP